MGSIRSRAARHLYTYILYDISDKAVYNSRRPMFAWAGPLAPTYPGGIPGGGDLIRIKPESGVITGRGQYAPNPGQP
eukprot:6135396-Pyramimonas_sp.AAC.1